MFRAAVGFVSSQAKMAKKQEKCCRTAKLRLASPREVGGGGNSAYEIGGDARRLA